MQNIKQTIKGNVLTLVIDLSENLGLSASGKSVKVATTSGNVPVRVEEDGSVTKLGVNVFRAVGA